MKALLLCICLCASPAYADFDPVSLNDSSVIASMVCGANICGLVVKDSHKYLVVIDEKGILLIYDVDADEPVLLYAREMI